MAASPAHNRPRSLCAVKVHHGAFSSCHLLIAQPRKQVQGPSALLTALLQVMLQLGCTSCQGQADLTTQAPKSQISSLLWKTRYSSSIPVLPSTASSLLYGCIREMSSKAEQPNKEVKPHFCNYVQQLHRNQNFFMSVD